MRSSLGGREGTTGEAGVQFITKLHAALRVFKMYPVENERSQTALNELTETAERVLDRENELELRTAAEFIFVNSIPLRLGLDNYATFGHVIDTLRRCDVGSVRVEPGIDRREWQVLVAALLTFAGSDGTVDKRVELSGRLIAGGATHVTVGPATYVEGDASEEEEKKAVAKQTYERGVGVTKDLVNSIRMGRSARLRKVKRAVQGIVDQVMNNETTMVGLSTIRDYDEYTFTHSVNVCIFSVSIGKRLGLSKLQLFDLGMCALLHDLGKSRVPVEVLNKAGGLEPEEWALMQSHPGRGVLALWQLQGNDIPLRAMVAAYEHHMKVSLTGYPLSKRTVEMSMYSKIVAVSDIFDAATSRRVYQTTPITPDKILHQMMVNSEKIGVDTVLVKGLINLLGVYPVGTCLILDNYELAIVHAANPDPQHINRPIVRILVSDSGMRLDPSPLANLADVAANGSFERSIIKVVDPDRYGITPSDYFV